MSRGVRVPQGFARVRSAGQADDANDVELGWTRANCNPTGLMVPSAIETVSSAVLDQVGMVVANDGARSSFTVVSGDALLALDPADQFV